MSFFYAYLIFEYLYAILKPGNSINMCTNYCQYRFNHHLVLWMVWYRIWDEEWHLKCCLLYFGCCIFTWDGVLIFAQYEELRSLKMVNFAFSLENCTAWKNTLWMAWVTNISCALMSFEPGFNWISAAAPNPSLSIIKVPPPLSLLSPFLPLSQVYWDHWQCGNGPPVSFQPAITRN